MAVNLAEMLNAFRALESDTDSVILLGDDHAMRTFVAWTKTDNVWSAPDKKPPPITHGKMTALWKWICAGWTIDAVAIARIAGLPVRVVHAKLEVLMGARLIYPDSSTPKATQLALTAYTAKQLGIKQQGSQGARAAPRKPPPDDPRSN